MLPPRGSAIPRFEADPKLAADRRAQPRYNAACAAALASVGKGIDEPAPDESAKVKLRAQARGAGSRPSSRRGPMSSIPGRLKTRPPRPLP